MACDDGRQRSLPGFAVGASTERVHRRRSRLGCAGVAGAFL